jgi:hypothetical protein
MSKIDEKQVAKNPAMQGDLGKFGGAPHSSFVQMSQADVTNMQALRADQMLRDF